MRHTPSFCLVLKEWRNRSMTTSFEDYVEKYCEGVSVAQAKEYAASGQELLAYINRDVKAHPKSDQELRDQSAFLLWYLIKASFDNGKDFGKGIFVIEMENQGKTERLYDYLRNGRSSIYSPETISDSSQRNSESLAMTSKGLKNAIKIS